MKQRSAAVAALAVLAVAPMSQADSVSGTLFYTRFCGGVNVKSVDFDYDGAATFTLGTPVGITSTNGADGIIFAPDGDLIVGGQNSGLVHKVVINTGMTTSVSAGFGVFHVMLDPDLRTVWGAGIPSSSLSEIPLNPFANGVTHNVVGDNTTITHMAFDAGGNAFYTSSGAGGNGSFGSINLNTFTTTQHIAPVPAAHGMAFDSFTGHLMLFGDGHITQIDPAAPTLIVSDRVVGGVQFDQGTVDGNGHMFVADNNGSLFFMDYSASGLVANAGNFIALQFLDTCLDDVAPLSGLGAPSGPGLDIKPGSCPNSYNRSNNGVLPVALVGTDTFDVADVDVTTLLLSRADGMAGSVAPLDGPPGPGLEFEDVATPFDGELCDCHEEAGDGITDLSVKFKTQDVVSALDLDEFDPGALVELCVSGETLDDEEFEACDCIRLVPPGTPPGLLSVGSNMPSVFIEASPLDEQLDGGGFGSFQRTYPLGTFVTLTAPSSYWGIPFAGWQVNDKNISVIDSPLVQSLSIDLFVIDDEQSVKAIYRNRKKSFDADGQQQQPLEN